MAKPNWAEWRDIPTAALWEVCALSLDIEPRTLKRYVEPYRNRDIILFEPFSDDETEKEFYRRCRILHANLNEPFFAAQYERPKNSDEVNIGAYVRICEFLTWVRQKEWSLPPELILPNTNQTHRSKTQKSAMDWQTEARRLASLVCIKHELGSEVEKTFQLRFYSTNVRNLMLDEFVKDKDAYRKKFGIRRDIPAKSTIEREALQGGKWFINRLTIARNVQSPNNSKQQSEVTGNAGKRRGLKK
jgi:hypothetical protein